MDRIHVLLLRSGCTILMLQLSNLKHTQTILRYKLQTPMNCMKLQIMCLKKIIANMVHCMCTIN